MTDLKTDAEKAEEIKQWWKENGTSVIAGVALAIGSVFGWQQWQAHKLKQAEKASALFAKQRSTPSSPETTSTLKTEFAGSPYAALAALSTAKAAAVSSDEQQAKNELKWTIQHSKDALLKQVATLRLIRLTINTQDFASAQSYLKESFNPAFSALVQELKGDLLLAQNQPQEAAKAYRQAIQLSGSNPPQYLQMKLDNLGNPITDGTKGA